MTQRLDMGQGIAFGILWLVITDLHTTDYLLIKGHKIPIWRFGDPKNPTIFFIHGFPKPFSAMIGDLPIRYLMDRYCIIAFDLPTFGAASKLSVVTNQFLKLVWNNFAANRPITVFGVSYGGLVALRFAAAYPSCVKNIIVAGTPYFRSPLHPLLALPIFLKKLHKRALSVTWQFNFLRSSDLTKIQQPVLLLYSQTDRLAPVWMGQHIAAQLPHAKVVTITGRSHGWLLHRVDENAFLPAILRFLS